jgi:hypothetical protein
VTTVEGARPLNREEMDRIRNAPYKLPPATAAAGTHTDEDFRATR